MSDVSLIPFNSDPDRVEVKTGSYTVLAGEYAFVSVSANDDGVFNIDGTAFIDRTSASVDVDTGTYTVATNHTFYGQAIAWADASGGTNTASVKLPNSYIVRAEGVSSAQVSTSQVSVTLRSGQAATIATAGTGSAGITGYEIKNGPSHGSFWAETGTAFTVSGSVRYTVSIYKSIT